MTADRVFADTNLFLRYLTNDVPAQAEAVQTLLERAASGELVLVTNSLVIAEIVWVLESFYHLSRPDVQEKVVAILSASGIEVEDAELILQAVTDYPALGVDYIDGYNAAWLRSRGMDVAYTFDEKHYKRFVGLVVKVP